jgi:hypothetical protein
MRKIPNQRIVRESVTFRVDFDGMTDRVREFWAEGKYQHAMNVIEQGFNLTRAQATEVLNGRKRFAQAPGGKPGLEGVLVDDAWSPKTAGFDFYPDATCPVMAAECLRLQRENDTLKEKLVNAAMNASLREEEIQGEVTALRTRVATARMQLRSPRSFGEVLLDRMLSLDKRPTPGPDRTFKSGNGWVTRDGKFYPCENSMEHIWLADRLGKTEKQAEEAGWVKLCEPMFDVFIFSSKGPTQRQINTVFDWAANQGRRAGAERAAKEWLERWKDETA